MNIKEVSAVLEDGHFKMENVGALNLIAGNNAPLCLDLLRTLLGEGASDNVLRHAYGIRAKGELDGSTLYFECAFKKNTSFAPLDISFDGKRGDKNIKSNYLRHLGECAGLGANVFDRSWAEREQVALGESKRYKRAFARFVQAVARACEKGDDRPVFVYDLAERVDQSVDVYALLAPLVEQGRQVFVAVPRGFDAKNQSSRIYQVPTHSERCCNFCGKVLDYWDLQEDISADRFIGYGSKYDLYRLQFKLCCGCFDRLLDQMAPKCKIPLLKGPLCEKQPQK